MSWESIPGWFSFGHAYDEMVDVARDGETIVEIGVAFGRSVAYLARKVIDSRKRVRVVGVDPWLDDRWEFPNDYPIDAPRPGWGGEHAEWARSVGGPFNAFVTMMNRHAPEELERITVLRCKSADAARIIGPCRGVLIDGSHNYEDVVHDIALWRPHIVSGGILAGDDYSEKDFPGVVRAVREACGGDYYDVKGTTWMVRR
jgi:cephalosporin hydroxylase